MHKVLPGTLPFLTLRLTTSCSCSECSQERYGKDCSEACGAGCSSTNTCNPVNGTCSCTDNWKHTQQQQQQQQQKQQKQTENQQNQHIYNLQAFIFLFLLQIMKTRTINIQGQKFKKHSYIKRFRWTRFHLLTRI